MQVSEEIIRFAKYCIVGGIAFVTDFITMSFLYKILNSVGWGLYIAVASGFLIGNVVNYVLSRRVVFNQNNENNSCTMSGFLIFTIIGLMGLALTEVGMYLGTEIIKMHYSLAKIIISIFVLFWNYIMRVALVFKKEKNHEKGCDCRGRTSRIGDSIYPFEK